MNGLAMGRIVHVRLPLAERCAIVTSVLDKEKGTIRCHIFNDPTDAPGALINPTTGMEYALKMEYSEKDEVGTWFWPPRA
jgi:hypothetical protein